MAAFELDADLTHPLDFLLLQNGPINLVAPQRLQALTDQLAALGYKVIHLPAADWSDDDGLFQSIAARLHFPDYFGHNYPALPSAFLTSLTVISAGHQPRTEASP